MEKFGTKNLIKYLTLFYLCIFFSIPAYAEIGRFTLEIAIIEGNFVKDEDLFNKIIALSTDDNLPTDLPPKIADTIQTFWHEAAVRACHSYTKSVINEKYEHKTLQQMKDSTDKIKEEVDIINSNCRYSFYIENWKKISSMINEKFMILRCSKAYTFSIRGLSCCVNGYKTKTDYIVK